MRVNPGNPECQLPRAEDRGHGRRRRAHAREWPALSSAGSHRSRAPLDRCRRAAGLGAARPSDRDQHAFPRCRSRGCRASANSPSSSARDVDSSRVSADTFTLRDAADQPVALAGVRVPAGRQNVVELTTAAPLAAGSYQLAVHGDGPAPLAGRGRSRARRRRRRQARWRHAHSLRRQRRSAR